MSVFGTSGSTIVPTQHPTLQFILTTEFGDRTEIIKQLSGSDVEAVFWAVRDCLAGCGYDHRSIEDWFPTESEEI